MGYFTIAHTTQTLRKKKTRFTNKTSKTTTRRNKMPPPLIPEQRISAPPSVARHLCSFFTYLAMLFGILTCILLIAAYTTSGNERRPMQNKNNELNRMPNFNQPKYASDYNSINVIMNNGKSVITPDEHLILIRRYFAGHPYPKNMDELKAAREDILREKASNDLKSSRRSELHDNMKYESENPKKNQTI